jgi:hypothetical protein
LRIASTGILQTNVDSAVDSNTKTKVAIGKGLLSVGSKIPIVGGLFAMLNSVVDTVYAKYKEAKFENRKNAINFLVMQNGTANTKEDLSWVLMKASIMLAESKSEIFI